MKPRRHFVFATFATLHLALCFPVTRSFAADGAVEAFFESKIRPLLAERCYECHGEKKQKGGLRLDSKGGWQKGGESGPALVPGKPESSLLIKAVSYVEKDLQMPPKKPLAADEVAALQEWIKEGAFDPRVTVVTVVAVAKPESDGWAAEFQKRLDWWSLQPLRHAKSPGVKDSASSREPADRFLRAALKTAGLASCERLFHFFWPAAVSKAASPMAKRMISATPSLPIQSTFTTFMQPFSTKWAWITRDSPFDRLDAITGLRKSTAT